MKQSWKIIEEEKRIFVGQLFIVEMYIVHVSKTPSQHITGIRLDLLGQGSFLCVHTCVCDLQIKNYYPYPSIQKKKLWLCNRLFLTHKSDTEIFYFCT